jgi:hypothetical protein
MAGKIAESVYWESLIEIIIMHMIWPCTEQMSVTTYIKGKNLLRNL